MIEVGFFLLNSKIKYNDIVIKEYFLFLKNKIIYVNYKIFL